MKRRILVAAAILLVVGVGYATWTLAGLPPIKYYLRHGLDPYCEPTGETVTYEGVEFVEIGPGIFRMGSTYLAEGGDWLGKICAPFGLPWGKHPKPSNEMPVHWVEFRQGYWIARTEITNAQYELFMPDHERNFDADGDQDPVVEVSWHDAKRYCALLSKKSGRPIRLPSEAEWECGCRAGNDGEFCFGDDEAELTEYAWYAGSFGALPPTDDHPHRVATKRRNRWGLCDLHGNVWEWCEDSYHASYRGAPVDGSARVPDPDGWVESGGPNRLCRGGDFSWEGWNCRSAFRNCNPPATRDWLVGFRPAFSNPEDE